MASFPPTHPLSWTSIFLVNSTITSQRHPKSSNPHHIRVKILDSSMSKWDWPTQVKSLSLGTLKFWNCYTQVANICPHATFLVTEGFKALLVIYLPWRYYFLVLHAKNQNATLNLHNATHKWYKGRLCVALLVGTSNSTYRYDCWMNKLNISIY